MLLPMMVRRRIPQIVKGMEKRTQAPKVPKIPRAKKVCLFEAAAACDDCSFHDDANHPEPI